MSVTEIRGSGQSWAVYVGGRQVGTYTNRYEKACIKAMKIERTLAQADRTCLTCRSTFVSDHRHNRMCPGCRAFAAGALI